MIMKIIQIDNFNRDYISDVLVAENLSQYYGKMILGLLIKYNTSESSPHYYRLVEDDYKLFVFEP